MRGIRWGRLAAPLVAAALLVGPARAEDLADKVNACLDDKEKLIAGKEADLEAALAEYHQALAAAVGEQAARLDMTLKAVADVAERVRSLQAS